MSELKEQTKREAPRVRFSAGFTANSGNFESIRMDVSIEDSSREGEKVSDTCDRVYAMVEKELVEKFTQTRTEIAEAEKKARKAKK